MRSPLANIARQVGSKEMAQEMFWYGCVLYGRKDW